jgi:hypothetical protein
VAQDLWGPIEEKPVSDDKSPQVPKRGDALWRSVKDDVAARNEATRRAAKLERTEHIRNADELRRAAGEKRQSKVRPSSDLG